MLVKLFINNLIPDLRWVCLRYLMPPVQIAFEGHFVTNRSFMSPPFGLLSLYLWHETLHTCYILITYLLHIRYIPI